MIVVDEDLERAGTRSRRQLTNPKPYSMYPPVETTFHSSMTKYSITQLFKNKTKVIVIACICLMFLFNLFYKPLVTPTAAPKTPSAFEGSTQFQDSTQATDYALLHRLLAEKKVSSSSSSSRINFSTFNENNPSHSSYAHRLSRGVVSGHTFDELRRLTNSVSLPITPTSNKHRRVPVTAIIHTTTVTQLYVQVQAVLTQTALPEHIWILCDTEAKQEVEARIMTLDRRRVKVMASDDTTLWLQTTSHIATEFVWMIDQDIAPGKRYLENLLKLSYTAQYRSALLGTEGALFSNEKEKGIECIPDAMHSGSRQMKSQAVDMINDSWLLHRSWLPYLLDAVEKEKITSMGLFISRTLYMTAGIPSIALPTDPIERAYWGDIRLQKTQKSETCKQLEDMLSEKQLYQTMQYRSQSTTETGQSILFFVDSEEQLKDLAPLVCQFKAKQQDDLHIVTSSASLSNQQQMKELLSNLCDKEEQGSTMIIHDLSVLHETGDNWNLVNDILHRLTRILSVVQPKVMIHTIKETNAIFESINSASKIVNVPSINLPTQEIPNALWITELPLDTISKWNTFTIKVMINTDKKPHALARLLSSATNAHYLGDNVDLTILMEQNSDRVTQTLVNNYKWKKGNKLVRHRISVANKASIFVESWYPASNDEYAIILNSELELSPLYYIWAKYAILRYRYHTENKTKHQSHLFGISLYAPRMLETDPSGRKLFNPKRELGKDDQPYVMQWPSYAGAVYFPEHWREFHDYITGRHADVNGFEMQDVIVPDLRSNEWAKSWRRYFEELVYLRSYVMLYPNFNGKSLSTLHLELRKKAMREQFVEAVSLYDVPLIQEQDQHLISTLILPEFDQLPVLDIYGKLSNFTQLKERGLELHEEVSSCPVPFVFDEELEGLTEAQPEYDPTDLLCPFARIVSVSLENENDEIPELPTKEVAVYI